MTLLRKPARGAVGVLHSIPPAEAGWRYVGFEVVRLGRGEAIARAAEGRETCLVLLAGRARVRVGDRDFGVVGGRTSPFDGLPWSIYAPAGSQCVVHAETPLLAGARRTEPD